MHQCSFSILKALNFDNFDTSHNNFLWPEYFIDFLCEWWIPCQASTSVLCLHKRPETVHCSTKDVYTSEMTFLALHPWVWVALSLFSVYIPPRNCSTLPDRRPNQTFSPLATFYIRGNCEHFTLFTLIFSSLSHGIQTCHFMYKMEGHLKIRLQLL